MLSEEQTSAIKQQLIEHIERSFPDERKEYAKEQVQHMTNQELEEFLIKNNLVAGQDSKCIFCSIVFGDIPSYKIDENNDAVAVLEINPMSKGHTLIIPKRHFQESAETEIFKEAEKLAKKISKKIQTKLKPKRVETIVSATFGHSLINLLPVYSNETFSSKRQAAKKEELEEVQNLLKITEKPKAQTSSSKFQTQKPKKSLIKKAEEAVKKFEEKLWLPQRIP